MIKALSSAWTVVLGFILGGQVMAQSASESNCKVVFQPTFGEARLDLENGPFAAPGDELEIETFRFYISDLGLWNEGREVWVEKNGFHLLDAANPHSLEIELALPEGIAYDSLQFHLGIDSLTNVSGAFGGDLDPTKGMYWAWNSGYINFKLEGRSPICPSRNNAFQFHLGGYLPPFQTFQTIRLPTSPSPEIHIKVDVADFPALLDLSKQHTIMSPSAEGASLSKSAVLIFSHAEN